MSLDDTDLPPANHGSAHIKIVRACLANIKNADRIVVLSSGRVVEQGTHAELHAACGHYHELYEIQAAAFRNGEP